jgi:membrane dipeptidase
MTTHETDFDGNFDPTAEALPVLDLHCDLLAYLTGIDDADPLGGDIGCSLPALHAGKVKLQTLAIFTMTGEGSVESGMEQAEAFQQIIEEYAEYVQDFDAMLDEAELFSDDDEDNDDDEYDDEENSNEDDDNESEYSDDEEEDDDDDENERAVNLVAGLLFGERTTVISAIENASGFCDEDEDLDAGLERLDTILTLAPPTLYVSLTHNLENRFGGGNFSGDNDGRDGGIGLKDDGRVLLEYLSGSGVAVDLSHASDALARDILEFTYARSLDLPVIASHSNFRAICDHVRNLPDDIAKEIIARGGLIGMNFCHEFIHESDSDVLLDHIAYGVDVLGGAKSIAFGSDYFFTPDDSEFFYDHRNSAQFPAIIAQASERFSEDQLHALAYGNVLNFIGTLWM